MPPAIGTYNEFAPRNIVATISGLPHVMEYLPDDVLKQKMNWSDRKFFWTILFMQHREWANKYYNDVLDFHHAKPKVNPKSKMINITDDWLDKLRAFDYETKGSQK